MADTPDFISPEEPVDLNNCDREPIHIPGRIQDFGFLLALDGDERVIRCSDNVGRFLERAPDQVLGRDVEEVLGRSATHALRGRMQMLHVEDGVERLFGVTLPGAAGRFDFAVHRSGALTIVEGEPSAGESADSAAVVSRITTRLSRAQDVQALADMAVRHLRALTGFDRVMVYRFAKDGSGEVMAEAARNGLPPYLGLHYPASDIPKQARVLYVRNLLRIIPDIGATPSAITPDSLHDGAPIDLSHSVLRAVSPIHIEYLQNIGVGASMSVSILRGGELWGLFACHHMGPLRVPYDTRTAAELFGQIFSFMLDTRIQAEAAQHEARARGVHGRMMHALAAGSPAIDNITAALDDMMELLDASGAAVRLGGRIASRGKVPGPDVLHALHNFLQAEGPNHIFATDALGEVFPGGKALAPDFAGALSIPLSRTNDDALIFFRPEVAKTVNWGGDPSKAAISGPEGARLSPRKSFELWKETVRGMSAPWSEHDQLIAESLRVSLLEVILQLTDAAARTQKESQQRQELLIAELNHRVRNILSLIRGLIAQSKVGANSIDELVSVIGARIQALARAHDQLTAGGWARRPLRDLILSEAEAYFGEKAHRIHMNGPGVLLTTEAFATLALVIHELATNSAKYGALADSSGDVRVDWRILSNGALELTWREAGGPPVKPPQRKGFGATIMERVVPHDLKGEAEIEFPLSGVRARFVIPALHIAGRISEDALQAKPRRAPAASGRLDLGRVLLVEDNLIIAMDAEDLLMRCGATAVEAAASAGEALRIIDRAAPDIAVLDVNLGAESSVKVAERLDALGIPYLYATGYGERGLPEGSTAPVVTKPYSAETMRPELALLLERRAPKA